MSKNCEKWSSQFPKAQSDVFFYCWFAVNCISIHTTYRSVDLSLCFQSDVLHQSVFELIHTDDRALFRRQLHFALNPTHGQQDGAAESPSKFSVLLIVYI